MNRTSSTHHLDETHLTMRTELFPGKEVKIDLASFIVGGSWESPNYAYGYQAIEYLYNRTKDIKDAVMVDVGANTGSFCLLPKFNQNIKRVLCIEPNIYIHHILQRNLYINGIIDKAELYWMAASDHHGEELFHVRLGSSGQGSILPITKRDPHAIQLKVKTMTLDELMNGQPIHILKIDAQGSDYAILKGAMETIAKHKPDILIEWTLLDKNIFDLLEPLGYHHEYVGTEDIYLTSRSIP